jgi:hypothetical protein
MARPAFQPTADQRNTVTALASYGVSHDDICRVVRWLGNPISPKTLRKHFGDELATGSVNANAAVAQSLFQKARGKGIGSVTACIFWLKARAGWRDVQSVELGGPDGEALDSGPLVVKFVEPKKPD